MIVSDIWNDAKSTRGFGNCDDATLYAAISESVRILANRVPDWDWTIGRAAFCAFDGYITLPREVETVLAANINGFPAWPRDKWFIHHLNGPGCYSKINAFHEFYDEVGQVSTFRDMPWPGYLIGVPESVADEGKLMLVYGYDVNDKELYHTDGDGNVVKGIRVPITLAAIPVFPDPVVVKSITRVVKGDTVGGVRLWAQDYNGIEPVTLLGYYYPDEREPQYKRMRFPKESEVYITFRRKTLDVKTQADWIPFESKVALLMMLNSLRRMYQGNLQEAQLFEEKAVTLLREEELAKKVRGSTGPQIRNFSSNNNERLRGRRR
jgi:hypothetical protein